jgi:tripartite-type tricarboxylate transporter receptor subunit TctC
VLGIAADRRFEDYSDIPTMAEGGVDLSISSWHGLFAPRGTPPAVVAKISTALGRVAANPEFQDRMRNLLLGVRYLDTAQFRAFFAEADKVNLDLIRKLGLLVSAPNQTK